MPRKRKHQPEPQPEGPPVGLFFGLTANQVVAFNLARARQMKQWTQDEAADALEPYLGKRWSKASFSAAERSVDSDRVRQFDADELVAFARAFEVPVSWFFLPPPPTTMYGEPVRLETGDGGIVGSPITLLADLVFGDESSIGKMDIMIRQFFEAAGPAALTDAQRRVRSLVDSKKAAVALEALNELERWKIELEALATHLGDLHRRARAVAADALDVPESEL